MSTDGNSSTAGPDGPDRPDGAADDDAPNDPGATERIGGITGTDLAWMLAIFGVGGAAVGALVPLLAGWAAQVPWMPFQGPLQLLGSFDQGWLVWGRPLLGLALGLALGAWVAYSSPVLHVGPQQIQVERRGEIERVISRGKVDAVFHRGSHLVLEAADGRTLFDAEVEGSRDGHRDVLVGAGYPWEGAPRPER